MTIKYRDIAATAADEVTKPLDDHAYPLDPPPPLRLSAAELADALQLLDEVGSWVGYIPGEITAIVGMVLCRRDGAAAMVARQLRELAS